MATEKKAAATPAETCYGCGAEAPAGTTHPMISVVNAKDVEKGTRSIANPNQDSAFVAVPVCDACWKDPAHRSAHAIKGHFFERRASKMALMMAGSSDIGG
jgi:hypothetical protein